ncbi:MULTISPECIES: pentapeptide repeat-containing protein [unclassified Maridesulfovibrio]|uniref:pentapeptide repeat-containing protein n=1 Tax=unclassified Maridesulfovibrio TaxID=2794999 RepID=UPI003B3F9CF5
MGCCVGADHSNWCEDYDIVYIDDEGKEYCIFHAPAECKFVELYDERDGGEKPALMEAKQFNGLVFARIDGVIEAGEDEERDRWDYFNWNPRCNFTSTIFPYPIRFNNSKVSNKLPAINFHKSIFTHDAFFYNIIFYNDINFKEVTFNKDSFFYRSIFKSMVSFESVIFKEKTEFDFSVFHNHTSFQQAEFHQKSTFDSVKFIDQVSFKNTTIKDYAYFANTQFRDNVDFSHSKSFFMYFPNAQFRGAANFSNIISKGDIDFTNVQFRHFSLFSDSEYDNAAFSYAQFRKDTSYSNFKIKRNSYFDGAEFRENVIFYNATLGKTTFSLAEVRKQANFKICFFYKSLFNEMRFKGPVYFDAAKFMNLASFKNTIFHDYSNFEQTEFNRGANFKRAFFKEWAYFRNTKFAKETTFSGAISKETILLESLDLSHVKLAETNIESFKFIDCNWGEERFAKIYDEKNDPKNCKDTTLAEIYRRLKKIARESADEEQTSHWHYREKEMTRRNLSCISLFQFWFTLIIAILMILLSGWLLQHMHPPYYAILPALIFLALPASLIREEICDRSKTAKLGSKIYLNIYRFISGYGEEPVRAFMVLFGLAALPFLLNFLVSLETLPQTDWIKQAMWYMPLIQIKFPDTINFTGLQYLLKGISVTAITLHAALFGFALRNKLRR